MQNYIHVHLHTTEKWKTSTDKSEQEVISLKAWEQVAPQVHINLLLRLECNVTKSSVPSAL